MLNRTANPDGLDASLFIKSAPNGVSKAFLVQAEDGLDYWCKATNNPTSTRIPINEQLASRWGRLIGVAVAEPRLIRLDALAGHSYCPERVIEPGWAHGCVAVADAIETRGAPAHRTDDDNARRHAGFFALADWVFGGDSQWLYSTSQRNAYYSHDHGHFFPGGPDWTLEQLPGCRDAAVSLGDPSGLDPQEIEQLATNIEAISRDDLEREASRLPADWPCTDEELAGLIDFVLHRRAGSAARLRALVP